jgi:hypothetical protein
MDAGTTAAWSTLVLAILGTAIGLVWKLTRVEKSLSEAIVKARADGDLRQDAHARDVGESLSALRTKINEVELHVRDNYLRRDSFVEFNRQITQDVRSMREELIRRLELLDAKLDARGGQTQN